MTREATTLRMIHGYLMAPDETEEEAMKIIAEKRRSYKRCSQCRNGPIDKITVPAAESESGEDEHYWDCKSCGKRSNVLPMRVRGQTKGKSSSSQTTGTKFKDPSEIVLPNLDTDEGRSQLSDMAISSLLVIATAAPTKDSAPSMPKTVVDAWEAAAKWLELRGKVTVPIGDEVDIKNMKKKTPEQLRRINDATKKALKLAGGVE